MINIEIYNDKNNNIVKYKVYGHSGYAEQGKDIVCAAVSSICQSALLGIIEVLKINAFFKTGEAYIECTLPNDIDKEDMEKASIILKTMLISLKQLQSQYRKHIQIVEREG